MRTFSTACLFLFFLFSSTIIAAGPSSNSITWDEFRDRAQTNSKIRFVLPDGVMVEGNPVSTTPDALSLRITKSSNLTLHPKRVETIPRASIRVVEMNTPSNKGRLIGTFAPLGAGIAIAALTAACMQTTSCPDIGSGEPYGVIAAGAIVAGVGTPVGYFVGRSVDRRMRTCTITQP